MASNKKYQVYILIFSIVFFILISYINRNSTFISEEGVVTKVIDGDTIVVDKGPKIRMLGIDSPEKGE